MTVTLTHAIQLERWSRGLSVMLEKTLGVTLVSKLRAILLMEADFNATNKIVYGDRMMKNVCKYNLMPEETFSEKNRMADNGTLCKTSSMTSRGRREFLRQSHQWTHQTVTTELPTLSHPSSFRHLEFPPQQLRQCLVQ